MRDRPWTMVEPFAGTAALSYHMLGATGHQVVPYQGSKFRFRATLRAVLAAAGFTGPPAVVDLSDLGFWGTAHSDLLCPWRRKRVITHLRCLAKLDPRETYEGMQGAEVSGSGYLATAQFLYLSRLSWSGKAVGCKGGRWRSPGLNTTSAYGLPATDKFSEVKPMVPSLIRTLGKLDLAAAVHRVRRGPARPPDGFQWRTVCYIDGPYRGTTGYPDGGMDRAGVVALALAWRAAGAFVLVSEGEAVEELVRRGWKATRLKKPKEKETQEFRGKQGEWLTVSPVAPR